MSLTRDQILAARRDRKPTSFDVPEWGGTIWLKVLSAQDQLDIAEGTEAKDMPLKVLVASIVDEQGTRLFSDDDAAELAQEDFPVIMRVFAATAKLNGLPTEELDKAVASFAPAPDEFSSTG